MWTMAGLGDHVHRMDPEQDLLQGHRRRRRMPISNRLIVTVCTPEEPGVSP